MFSSHIRTVSGPLFVVIFVLTVILLQTVSGLRFHLPANDKRCLKEEMRKDVMLTGDFELSDSPGVRTDLTVSFVT